MQQWVRDLNATYRAYPALYEQDFTWEGFSWVDCHDRDNSTLSFLRYGSQGEALLVVFNMTPVPRWNYRVGVPRSGWWKEILNSDGHVYGGSGMGNEGGQQAEEVPSHGYPASVELTLPPLGVLFLVGEGGTSHA